MFEGQRNRRHSPGETHSYGVEIDRSELTNRVTTPFTSVGNSADLQGLAQCGDTVYCTA